MKKEIAENNHLKKEKISDIIDGGYVFLTIEKCTK